LKKNIFLKSIKDDHADGYRSGSGLIRSTLGDLELPSQKNHTFITIWKSWFSYEFPLLPRADQRTFHTSLDTQQPLTNVKVFNCEVFL